MSVLKVDKTVDTENPQHGALEILKLVRPNWNENKITTKIFTNGITNKMFGFFHDNDNDDTVLVRVNGNGTEKFLDRNSEVKNFELLHNHKCAPLLYCAFNNGLSYQYIKGVTLTRESVRNPKIFNSVAIEIARLHSIPPSEKFPCKPSLFHLLRKFVKIAFSEKDYSTLTNGSKNEEINAEAIFKTEINFLETTLTKLNSPVVFCHNDILLHNVIYNADTNKASLIDYEYAGFNYQALDIGNHFCEFAGVEDIDYTMYPGENLQKEWLKCYLTELNKIKGKSTSDEQMVMDIDNLYKLSNKFALAAHIMWSIWALVQHKFSLLDFDYKKYSAFRLSEYFKRKGEFLAM